MDDCTNQELHDGQRIMNKDDFIRKVGRGSHVAEKVCRLGIANYYHHFLVTQVDAKIIRVIHYAKTRVPTVFRVQETHLHFDHDLTTQTFERGVYLIWSKGYPESEQDKEEAILRARSRLGERLYMMAINNCEHFVTWALTQTPFSRQIQDAKSLDKCGVDIIDACYTTSTLTSLTANCGRNIIMRQKAAQKQKLKQSLNQAVDEARNELEVTAAAKANSETTDQTRVQNAETMDNRVTGRKSPETADINISKKSLETEDNTYLKATDESGKKLEATAATKQNSETTDQTTVQNAETIVGRGTGRKCTETAGKTISKKSLETERNINLKAVDEAGKHMEETTDTKPMQKTETIVDRGIESNSTKTTGNNITIKGMKTERNTCYEGAATNTVCKIGTTSAKMASEISIQTAGGIVAGTAMTGTALVDFAKKRVVTTAQTSVIKETSKKTVETAKAISAAGNTIIKTTKNQAAPTTKKIATEKAKNALVHSTRTTVTKKAGTAVASASRGVIFDKVGNETGKKMGGRGIYISKTAVKTAQKTGESAANAKSLLKSTAKAAAFAAIVEGGYLAKEIYDLKKARDHGHISERDFKRGTITKTSGAFGSVGGAVLGQIIFPVPGVGAFVGSVAFGAIGKAAFSTVSGILFDNA